MFGTLVIFLAPVLLFWALIGVIFGVYKNWYLETKKVNKK
jgi:hypothetical protein